MANNTTSKEIAAKVIYAAFQILKEAGGQMHNREVMNKIEERIEFSDWEKGLYEKTGYVRWKSILHFYTIDCVKAGYLRKQKGIWYLTKEGETAMKEGPEKLIESATKKYREWTQENKRNEVDNVEPEPFDEQIQKATLEQLEEKALDGLREYINKKNPYDIQDMVAALLRAMGYFTPFVSPVGKDGGVDIIAYQDPLGTKAPRIKVQVKHKPNTAVPVSDIRSLLGLLNKEGDVGIFMTTGTYTNEAERLARSSHIHVELIDFTRFISLWQEYYPKFTDEEKNMLPIQPIYFLGANE